MSSPLKSPVTASLLVGGAIIGFAGVAFWLIEGALTFAGLIMAFGGLTLIFTGAWVHDRGHRRRRESPHAMWGVNDKNRPSWFPRHRE